MDSARPCKAHPRESHAGRLTECRLVSGTPANGHKCNSRTMSVRKHSYDVKLTGRKDALSTLCLPACIVLITLAAVLATRVDCTDELSRSSDSGRRGPDSLADTDPVVGAEPRQYFKIHSSSGQSGRRRVYRGSGLGRRNEQSAATTGGPHQQHELNGGQKPKISNATLKKLLNQSILLATNGSSSANSYKGDKSSHFKFVFIQRATAAPKTTHSAGDLALAAGVQTKSSANSTTSPPQASLAASVSKQLAKTLLSSATDLVANISSMPSLSALASQMVGQSVDLTELNSISRRKIGGKEHQKGGNFINERPSTTKPPVKGSTSGTKSRPSKIYNLPVKFVANGQPNHVVFSTIKKHFATIKKLQDNRQKLSGSTLKMSEQDKRRKQKIKGNSRLIYLPIKYLSNARPNSVLITQISKTHTAKHKSTSSLKSTSAR